ASTVLSGHLSAGPMSAAGNVSITLDGVTQQATLDSSGDFSSTFATATLGVAGSPHTVTYRYPGTGAFTSATDGSTSVTVTRPPPTTTLAAPAAIPYGPPFSAAQLAAATNVPGSFAYSPAPGTILGLGGHALSVTFTPADAADYNSVTQT